MRKQNSIFNDLVNFINSVKKSEAMEGSSTYTTRKMHWSVTGNTYRRASYQTMLKRTGFIRNVRRGLWEVTREVPDWFTISHLNTLLGYGTWFYKDGKTQWKRRTKMTREEILEKLNAKTATVSKDSTPEWKELGYWADGSGSFSDLKAEMLRLHGNVKITKRSSKKTKSTQKSSTYTSQLHENLTSNVNYIAIALENIDRAELLDSALHGRLINIFVQVKDLHQEILNRINFEKTYKYEV